MLQGLVNIVPYVAKLKNKLENSYTILSEYLLVLWALVLIIY